MVPGVLWKMLPLVAAVGREGVEMILVMHWDASQVLVDNWLIVMEPVSYDPGYYHGVTGCCSVGWVWYTMNYQDIQSYTCCHYTTGNLDHHCLCICCFSSCYWGCF